MPNDARPLQLVVVGSSAGGIEALSTLVSTLPADFPAPVVIAQHLDPARVSHLGEILDHRGPLPVHIVEEPVALEGGCVYVVPAGFDVVITDHEVRLQQSDCKPTPSINHLLSSAAGIFGENLIAVILTGTGSDAASGALDVEKAGGTVVIQDPRTAAYPALPRSLPPTAVDIIANIDEIGPILSQLLSGAYVPLESTESAALRTVLGQLQERHGVDFDSYKRPTILRRLQRRMVATGNGSMEEYASYVQTHPEEFQQLLSSFLIKVTEFFRDQELYCYLRNSVLPDLIEHARRRDHELRFWSAGCATGEEPYSLAILVAELLGEELGDFHIRIFATDLDADAIEFARQGIYPRSAVENISPELVEKYFTKLDGDYQVKKNIRALTVFGRHDLGERAPFPRIDLLTCRNVLIYFTTELQRHVLQLAAFSLRAGGYLVLGKAETIRPLAEYFVSDDQSLKVYRRRGDRAATPGRLSDTMRLLPIRHAVNQPPSQIAGRPAREAKHRSTLSWEAMFQQLSVGLVVVNQRYDIQAINNLARRTLGIHTPAVGDDLVHLAQTLPSRQLRAAIDRAFREEQPVTVDEPMVVSHASGEDCYLQITCSPATEIGEAGPTVTVVLEDVTQLVRKHQASEEARRDRELEITRASARLQQATASNQELLRANQELTMANMELRGANEEFLVGNEELQAAAEEVETLNEELQATNEELETLNEELQATVEELNTTNDDLQARSDELQELADSLTAERRGSEMERARLSAILLSMGDAVLVLDIEGRPTSTNAAYARMFGTPDATFVPEDPSGHLLPPAETPQGRATRGESFSMEFLITDPAANRRYFEVNGQPILQDGKTAGAVLVIRDITDRNLRRLQNEFLAIASHELRTPLTVLNGYLSMVERLPIEDQRLRQYIVRSREQSRRMERLVRDLLDVARLRNGRLTLDHVRVDLTGLVRNSVETAQSLSETQSIHLDVGGGPVTVEVDPARLEQVLLNLLLNAMKYASQSERIDVHLKRERGEAVLAVQDYGPGIPPEERLNIFSRFYTGGPEENRQGGLGLGLYISQQIITTLGGTIDVASELGHGSTFTIRLPLVK